MSANYEQIVAAINEGLAEIIDSIIESLKPEPPFNMDEAIAIALEGAKMGGDFSD